MSKLDMFYEVFEDIRFPFLAVDLERLGVGLDRVVKTGPLSHFAFPLDVPPSKRGAIISSFRGMYSKVKVPAWVVGLLSQSAPFRGTPRAHHLVELAGRRPLFVIAERENFLVWEEESLWPLAYSTLLQQLLSILYFHKTLIEERVRETAERLKARGYAPENVGTVSEFPRQLPTHIHYAFASLGAWLGGAINVQYFAYYAAIRQIHHPSLNLNYASKIGFETSLAQELTSSGLLALPNALVWPLLEAQGDHRVFGSISIDEVNASNPPNDAFFQRNIPGDEPALSGYIADKYYRSTFLARRPNSQGFYGSKNILRDHYDEFYKDLDPDCLIRCKHYCVPLVRVSSIEELRVYTARIPIFHYAGLLFRGQRSLYLIQREESIRKMLFADSCSVEPSLITSASRDLAYDYDVVHFELKHFLERQVLIRDELQGSDLHAEWRRRSMSPVCKLDLAVLAMAQHYGLPSHGLDVTTSDDVAVWFATSVFQKSPTSGLASFASLRPEDWGPDPNKWPVIVVSQIVTDSIEASLHDCEELAAFGFEAARPVAQSAKFFQGGHSDHQNRLAEAVVCVFRLAPGEYGTEATFESLFPSPDKDPAYRVMLEFANSSEFAHRWGKFVNNFHQSPG